MGDVFAVFSSVLESLKLFLSGFNTRSNKICSLLVRSGVIETDLNKFKEATYSILQSSRPFWSH